MVNNMENSQGGYKRDRSGSERSGYSSAKVYVSNIDFACTHTDLKEVFSEVGDVAFVEMLKDEKDRPNGTALVRFKDSSCTEEAIRHLNRREVNGRKIVVKDERDAPKNILDRGGDRDRKRPRMGDGDFNDGMRSGGAQGLAGSDKFGNTYGLSVQFLESLGIELPLTNKIFIANLDYGTTEEEIEKICNLAGHVEYVELALDQDKKSKGYGFVDYEHPVEAVQAISMLHNQLYKDRPMSVQLTRRERKEGALKLPPGLKNVGAGLGPNGAPLRNVARAVASGNIPGMGAAANPLADPQGGLMGPNMVGTGASLGLGMGAQPVPLANQGLGMGLNPLSGLGTDTALASAALMARRDNYLGSNAAGLLGQPQQSLLAQTQQSLLAQNQQGLLGQSQQGLLGQAQQGLLGQSQQGMLGQSQQSLMGIPQSSLRSSNYSGQRDHSRGQLQNRDGGRGSKGSHSGGRGLAGERPGSERISPFTNYRNAGGQDGHRGGASNRGSENVVEISNLPEDYTWKGLQNFCTPFGEISFIKMTGRGTGTVHFETEDAARSAVDMLNNQRFEGKYLRVQRL